MADRSRGQPLSEEEHATAKRRFLEEYATGGVVTPALAAAGVSYPTYSRWKEHDEDFVNEFHLAQKAADDTIRSEIKRRALVGVEEPVFYQGEEVSRVRKYSDVLLIFLAKSRMPEFREKQQIEHTGTLTLTDLVQKAVVPVDVSS